MKLRELFENIYAEEQPAEFNGALKVIGVCYGRWNPPHKGHKAVWQSAATNPIWYVGTNENTEGPKDPLPYDVKLQCMAAVWPKVAGHVIPEQSLLTLASRIYEEHGENVHLKVYTDEEWLYKTLAQYNGVNDKPHGNYKFNQIDWVRTERLARATDLRDAVRRGDKAAFYKDAGIKPSVTIEVNEQHLPIFDVVAHYLNKYPSKVKSPDAMQVAEAKGNGKMRHRDEHSQRGILKMRDVGGYDRVYHLNRIMMAAGLSDGSGKPVDMDPASWIEKFNTGHPFTEEEFKMLQAAMKTIPTDGSIIQKWSKSQEMPHTNTKSAVATPKKNKYGV